MARDSRRKTQREQVDLRDQRPTQLDVSKRYFMAGGFDNNVRTARALEKALGIGADAYINIKDAKNAEQRERAVNERAAGGERDVDEKSLAYHRQWDALDADYDYQQVASSLPETLRQSNWEDLPEEEVQALISSELQGLFAGVENMKDSAYAQTIAPALLDLEAKLIGEHRQMQIERTHEEQRTKTFATFSNDYQTRLNAYNEAGDPTQPAPLPAYQTLFDRTGIFFDGKAKKTVFWESVYDLAIRMGDPSIIANVPKMMNGVPTGIEDPALQDSHRTAVAQAQARRDSMDEAARKASEAEKKRIHEATNRNIAGFILDGIDPLTYIQEGLALGTIEREDASSLIGMWRSQRDDGAKHSFNPNVTAQLRSDLATNPAGVPISRINDALAAHAFGPAWSPEAHAIHRQMLQDREDSIGAQSRIAADPVGKSYLRQFEQAFPVPKDQFGVIKAPAEELELRANYVGALTRSLLAGGRDPAEIYKEHYAAYKEDLSLVKTQLAARSPERNVQALVEGHFTPEQFVAQSTERGWDLSHYRQLRDNESIDSETYKKIVQLLYQNR